jgi:hypothetical protein
MLQIIYVGRGGAVQGGIVVGYPQNLMAPT